MELTIGIEQIINFQALWHDPQLQDCKRGVRDVNTRLLAETFSKLSFEEREDSWKTFILRTLFCDLNNVFFLFGDIHGDSKLLSAFP
jgi:hypothetical protein